LLDVVTGRQKRRVLYYVLIVRFDGTSRRKRQFCKGCSIGSEVSAARVAESPQHSPRLQVCVRDDRTGYRVGLSGKTVIWINQTAVRVGELWARVHRVVSVEQRVIVR
jgi:hypothetical protein